MSNLNLVPKVKLDVFNVKDFGAIGNEVNDDTNAIQKAIDYAESLVQLVWEQGGVIYFPVGRYKVTSTLTINESNIILQGDSADVSIIYFEPTANDICVHFAQSAPSDIIRRGCGVKKLGFRSNNTTNTKTAIQIDDVSVFNIKDVFIGRGGTVTVPGYWWTNDSGGDDCVGIQINGREGIFLDNIQIYSDTCIKGGLNPSSTPGFTFDDLHIKDTWLVTTNGDGKCIDMEVEGGLRGLYCEQVAFISCLYGFYHIATTNTDTCSNFKFSNCLIEQMNADGWPIYIDRSSATHPVENLTISNWSGPSSTDDTNGFYLDAVELIGFYEVFQNANKTAIVVKNCKSFSGFNSVIGVGKSVAPTEWATSTVYADGDLVTNDTGYEKYECISAHTSSATDEPGVGASWTTYWVLLADIDAMQLGWATGDSTAYTRALPSNNWNYIPNLGNSITNIDLVNSTQLADKDHKINNVNKFPMRQVYDQTTKLVYTTEGQSATSPWYPSDGGTAVTPA
jgi:hypothetical protein